MWCTVLPRLGKVCAHGLAAFWVFAVRQQQLEAADRWKHSGREHASVCSGHASGALMSSSGGMRADEPPHVEAGLPVNATVIKASVVATPAYLPNSLRSNSSTGS